VTLYALSPSGPPEGTEIFATSLTPGSSPSDRYQTTLDRVWTGTMDTGPKSVTIRRSAPSGWLGTAPREPHLSSVQRVGEQKR